MAPPASMCIVVIRDTSEGLALQFTRGAALCGLADLDLHADDSEEVVSMKIREFLSPGQRCEVIDHRHQHSYWVVAD